MGQKSQRGNVARNDVRRLRELKFQSPTEDDTHERDVVAADPGQT